MANERTIVSLEELSAWMTERVQMHEDCAQTKVSVQYRLQSPDAYGCNWSDNVVFNLRPNASTDVVLTLVRDLTCEARQKFNVRE